MEQSMLTAAAKNIQARIDATKSSMKCIVEAHDHYDESYRSFVPMHSDQKTKVKLVTDSLNATFEVLKAQLKDLRAEREIERTKDIPNTPFDLDLEMWDLRLKPERKHQRHFIDGDQVSPVIIQQLLGELGSNDNVAITIAHNDCFGSYNTSFCAQCKSLGIKDIKVPTVKNGADFVLISEMTASLCTGRTNSEYYLHTNDHALAVAAQSIALRYFVMLKIVPVIAKKSYQ